MAHKKGQGSSRNGRDSNPQYRGIKLYGGQAAKAGSIIVRQCGTKFFPGVNVDLPQSKFLVGRDPGRDIDEVFVIAPIVGAIEGQLAALRSISPNDPQPILFHVTGECR